MSVCASTIIFAFVAGIGVVFGLLNFVFIVKKWNPPRTFISRLFSWLWTPLCFILALQALFLLLVLEPSFVSSTTYGTYKALKFGALLIGPLISLCWMIFTAFAIWSQVRSIYIGNTDEAQLAASVDHALLKWKVPLFLLALACIVGDPFFTYFGIGLDDLYYGSWSLLCDFGFVLLFLIFFAWHSVYSCVVKKETERLSLIPRVHNHPLKSILIVIVAVIVAVLFFLLFLGQSFDHVTLTSWVDSALLSMATQQQCLAFNGLSNYVFLVVWALVALILSWVYSPWFLGCCPCCRSCWHTAAVVPVPVAVDSATSVVPFADSAVR